MNREIVAEEVDFCHNGGMSEPGKMNHELNQSKSDNQGPETMKMGLMDRVSLTIVRYFTSPTRLREVATAIPMYATESIYDTRKVAIEGNEFGNKYWGMHEGNVGPLPSDPDVRATLDVLGDMWEISVGQTIVRGGLHLLYESLGKEPLSDDDTFALSLLIPLVLKSAHTMGLISIFGVHDRIGNAAPEMLIGQIVASCALMIAHYSARNKEIRKNMGLPDISLTGKIKKGVEKGLRAVFESYGELSTPQERVNAAVANLAAENGDEVD